MFLQNHLRKPQEVKKVIFFKVVPLRRGVGGGKRPAIKKKNFSFNLTKKFRPLSSRGGGGRALMTRTFKKIFLRLPLQK